MCHRPGFAVSGGGSVSGVALVHLSLAAQARRLYQAAGRLHGWYPWPSHALVPVPRPLQNLDCDGQ
jgi:hypothetical protein